MDISSDYKDLLRIFNRDKIKYLIVGAYAVIFYTEPRYSKDIDIWISPDIDNAKKAYKALGEFGAPLKNISPEDFTRKDMVYQIGVEPVRIDIIMGLSGIDFHTAWKARKKSDYAGISVNMIGIEDLKRSKLAAKRPQDLLDLSKLNKKNN